MKSYLKIALVVLGLISGKVFAQVGMNGNSPAKSAALDINANNQGLLISSISLSSTTDVSGIAGNAPANSLLIYNTNPNITGTGAAKTGYYYWDATATPAPGIWKKLAGASDIQDSAWYLKGNQSTIAGTNYIGTNDNADFVTKTSGVERMRVAVNGNVGIGTSSTSYKMEVNGTTKVDGYLFLGSAKRAPQDSVSQLVIDNSTGQVLAYALGPNIKTFSYLKYTLKNVQGDWVNDFNTNIDTATYSLVIVGNAFTPPVNTGMVVQAGSGGGSFDPQAVFAFASGTPATWHIRADYINGAPTSGNGSWDIYCLVINKVALATLPNQTFNLYGSEIGDAGSRPPGL